MLRVGLIGTGGMGSVHLECYQFLEQKGVKVTAVADTDDAKRAKAAGKYSAAAYTTGMELIEKADVDLIDICLPTYVHAALAVAAMDKKRHILIEKPVCLTAEELRLLRQKRKETGVDVGVCQCLRFWDEYEWLKKAVDDRRYGKPLSAVFTRISPPPAWSTWFHDPRLSGTAALDLHIHDVDMLRFLFGEPDFVQSSAVRDREGVIQHIFSSYRVGSLVATSEGGWAYPAKFPFTMAYRVNFEDGAAVFDSSRKPALTVYPKDADPFVPDFAGFKAETDAGINVSSLGAYYKELDYFTGCLIRGERIAKATLDEVSSSMELALREIELCGGAVAAV
jgi:predicted dehydrogenase